VSNAAALIILGNGGLIGESRRDEEECGGCEYEISGEEEETSENNLSCVHDKDFIENTT
jgi:hypothetical protein